MKKIIVLLTLVLSITGCDSEQTATSSQPAANNVPVGSELPLPSASSVIINAGAEKTASTAVNLNISSIGAADMAVFNNSNCSGTVTWESYNTSKSWVLASTNSSVSVSIKFRNANSQESECVSDDIIHDNQAPAAVVISSHGQNAVVENRTQVFSGTCDALATHVVSVGSGASIVNQSCSVGGVFQLTLNFSYLENQGDRTFTVTSTDDLGNSSSVVQTVSLKQVIGNVQNVFGSGVSSRINQLALQSDGKIVVVGAFTKRVARFNADGSVDTAFDTKIGVGANAEVKSVAVLSDGGIVLGGTFSKFNNVTVPRLVKLQSDGTIDNVFKSNIGVGPAGGTLDVQSMVVQGSSLYIAGPFSTFNSFPVGKTVGIHKLSFLGVRDASFDVPAMANASSQVLSLVALASGKIAVGCRKGTTVGGSAANGFFILSSNGSVDSSGGFENAAAKKVLTNNAYVRAITEVQGGSLVIAGSFTSYGDETGVARTVSRIVRVSGSGVFDADFNNKIGTGFNGDVYSVVQQDDGKLLVAGNFTKYKGTTVGRLVRLHTDMNLDTQFTGVLLPAVSSAGYNAVVRSIKSDGLGRLITVGDFTALNSTAANRILRLY